MKISEAIELINKTPELQSILDDVNLLPEQVFDIRGEECNSTNVKRMLAIVNLWSKASDK